MAGSARRSVISSMGIIVYGRCEQIHAGDRALLTSDFMEAQDSDTDWKPRAFEALKSLAIVGVVAPVVGGCLFWLIMMFPVIFMGQPKEGMIGWGFITIPAAILVA